MAGEWGVETGTGGGSGCEGQGDHIRKQHRKSRDGAIGGVLDASSIAGRVKLCVQVWGGRGGLAWQKGKN